VKRWNENQASQRIVAPTQTLATFGGTTGAPGIVTFRVPLVDARIRTILSVVFVPPAGFVKSTTATALAGTANLWLYGEKQDESGVSGGIFPVSNIEGTQAAPTTIPLAGLFGYSREFNSGIDFVGGIFQGAGGPAGSWVLEVVYQPEAGVVLSPLEYDQIIAQCNPQLLTPAAVVA
jgi:hypothetical protein